MASGGSLTGQEVRGAVFAKPPLGSHGYDPHEVDEFMARIADTLDGFGSVTADEVVSKRFGLAPRWGNRGYRQDEVDAVLDVVAAILRQRADGGETSSGSPPVRDEPLGGYQLRQASFRKVSAGRGYDTSAVDELLEQLAATLDGTGPRRTPEEVHLMTLPSATGLHRGYDELEVDALLDRIVAELRRRNAGG